MALNGRAISIEGVRFVVATSVPGTVAQEIAPAAPPNDPVNNEIVVLDNNSIATLAQANQQQPTVLGLFRGSSSVQTNGEGEVVMDAGLTITYGDSIYVSPTTAGVGTNVEPTTSGQVIQPIGQVIDVLSYSGMAGQTVLMLLQVQDPIDII